MIPTLYFEIKDVTAYPTGSGVGAQVTVRPRGNRKSGTDCSGASFYFFVQDEHAANELLERWREWCAAAKVDVNSVLYFPLPVSVDAIMQPGESEA